MAEIEVRGATIARGWRFEVTVSDESASTRHEVTLDGADYERLTDGRAPPERLVRESFAFLLEREPKEAILGRFDLSVIGQYFADYEQELKSRLAG
jgi:hypothetical protein